MRKALGLLTILVCLAAWPAEASEKSGYVLPPLPVDDHGYSTNTDSKSTPDLAEAEGAVQSSDLSNGLLGKLGGGIPDPDSTATLQRHICGIVSLHSQKQMIGPDAWRVVAGMQNAKPIGDWSVMQLPRDDVGTLTLAEFGHPNTAAISMVIKTSSPQPTSVRLLDLRPEALGERLARSSFVSARLTTVLPLTASQLIRPDFKRFGANSADNGNHNPSHQGNRFGSDSAGRSVGSLLFAPSGYPSQKDNTSYHHQAGTLRIPTAKTGFQKFLTVALYPFTPWRRDTEDRVMNWLNAGYVSVGYWDLYETLNALSASPTIRETSPVFADFLNGRPHPAAAFAAHTGVNYLFLTGIRYAHNWAHDRNSQSQGKWKRASEYVLWGLVVGLTIDRGFTAKHNRDLAAKYGK